MKPSTLVMSLITTAGLALATSVALAQPWGGGPGAGRGPGFGPAHGMGMMGGGCGNAQGAGPLGQGATPLFTPEEITAFRDQMRAAATIEERQKLMLEHRTEMQRRAAERGWTCPGLAANTGK